MTAETAQQKEVRRSVSGKVTEILNTVTTVGRRQTGGAEAAVIGRQIRLALLTTLRNVDRQIALIEREVQDELNLTVTPGKLIKFYMKGGNAYNCVVGSVHELANSRSVIGGGTSDWDTQVVINPWLPSPVRTRLHNEVVEIALSAFRDCAKNIAQIVHDNNIDVVLDLNTGALNCQTALNAGGIQPGHYAFILDEQQTTRKIFSYDNLGMIFDDRVAISPAEGTDKKDGPGILLHSAIKPFELYRLGYLGKVYKLNHLPTPDNALSAADYDTRTLLPRKSLAELIDITIPRLGTVEAFEVWESLEANHITINRENLTVNNQLADQVPIPLPDINYHKLENLLMLCEMADGSSRHYNKLPKRVKRLKQACETQVTAGALADAVKLPMLHMVGVAAEGELITNNHQATTDIDGYLHIHDPDYANHPNPYSVVDSWHAFIRKLMIHVRACRDANANGLMDVTWQNDEVNRQARNRDNNVARAIWADIYNTLATTNNSHPMRISSNNPVPSIQRYRSDDLALLDLVLRTASPSSNIAYNSLVDARALKPSTISHWRILRVDDRGSLLKVLEVFKAKFDAKKHHDPSLNYVHKLYTREDHRGHISECLIIAKKGEKILSVVTLVAGADARTGHTRMSTIDSDLGKNTIAVLADIARQRKLTAAMIHDYTLKAVLAKHYSIAKQLVDVD